MNKIGIIIAIIVFIGLVILGVTTSTKKDVAVTETNIMNSTTDTQRPNGLIVEVLQEGTGVASTNGQTVSVHYTGTFLSDGKKFDSSVDRGVPFEFVLGGGQVIEGWDLGVLGMKVGEKRKIIVPPELGYGANDYGPIPGNSTLVFEVELLGIRS